MPNIAQEAMLVPSPALIFVQATKLTVMLGLVAWSSTGTGTLSRTERSDRYPRRDVRGQRLGIFYPRRQTGYFRGCRRRGKGNALLSNTAGTPVGRRDRRIRGERSGCCSRRE